MKNKKLSALDLFQAQLELEALTPEFCMNWFEQNRNKNRVLFPDYLGIIAPFTPKCISTLLGYEWTEGINGDSCAYLVITDKSMKRKRKGILIRYQKLSEGILADSIGKDTLLRINFFE